MGKLGISKLNQVILQAFEKSKFNYEKKKKKYLITGVAGMIGSELLKNDNKNNLIIGIDNFTLGKNKNIKKYKSSKNFNFYNIDLSKKLKIEIYLNYYKINL